MSRAKKRARPKVRVSVERAKPADRAPSFPSRMTGVEMKRLALSGRLTEAIAYARHGALPSDARTPSGKPYDFGEHDLDRLLGFPVDATLRRFEAAIERERDGARRRALEECRARLAWLRFGDVPDRAADLEWRRALARARDRFGIAPIGDIEAEPSALEELRAAADAYQRAHGAMGQTLYARRVEALAAELAEVIGLALAKLDAMQDEAGGALLLLPGKSGKRVEELAALEARLRAAGFRPAHIARLFGAKDVRAWAQALRARARSRR